MSPIEAHSSLSRLISSQAGQWNFKMGQDLVNCVEMYTSTSNECGSLIISQYKSGLICANVLTRLY